MICTCPLAHCGVFLEKKNCFGKESGLGVEPVADSSVGMLKQCKESEKQNHNHRQEDAALRLLSELSSMLPANIWSALRSAVAEG